jgi:dihydroneopterin aldolase
MTETPFTVGDARMSAARIFVRDLRIDARIGLYEHEHGRTQPLVLEVELEMQPHAFENAGDIVNYENIGAWAREVAATGHIELLETFTQRVAVACMRDHRVISARVRIEKPQALAPAVAGVEIVLTR